MKTFVTPDIVYLQEASGAWWRISPEKYQVLTKTAFQRKKVGPALSKLGRRLKGEPRGLEALPQGAASAAIEGVGFVRCPRTAQDWKDSLANLDLRPERFNFLTFVFDVSLAKRLARRRHLEVEHAMPTEEWWGRGWRGAIKVNQKHLQRRLNLSKPVIRGRLIDEVGEFTLLIDGNHRATLALARQVEVPFVMLSVQDTLDTVINAGAIRSLRTRRLRQAHAGQDI